MKNKKKFITIAILIFIFFVTSFVFVKFPGLFSWELVDKMNERNELVKTLKFNDLIKQEVNLSEETVYSSNKIVSLSGLYQFIKPDGWRIKSSDFILGVGHKLILQTDDFSSHLIASDDFPQKKYDSGATLSITVTKGKREIKHGKNQILETSTFNFKGGIDGEYHRFSESFVLGQLRDVHINHQGNYYIIRFAYDTESYPEGEKVFKQILDSFEFIEG